MSLQAQLSFFSPFNPLPPEPIMVVVPTNGNPITITDVSGPTNLHCGGFFWQVNFTLSAPSANGGYIVQEIEFTKSIDNCDGTPKEHKKYHFWEAWRVAKGATGDSLRLAGTFTFDDQYSSPSEPNTKGSKKVTGKVQFFDGVSLPPGFIPNHPGTTAGGLPSDTLKPPFFNTNEAINHNLCVTWNCCGKDTIDTLTTVRGDTTTVIIGDDPPVITGVPTTTDTIPTDTIIKDTAVIIDDGIKTRPDKGDRTKGTTTTTKGGTGYVKQPRLATGEDPIAKDPIVRLIRLLPAWTQPLEEIDQAKFMEVAAELSKVPNEQLRDAIEQHWELYRKTQTNLEELSKLYLLARVLFDVPNNYVNSDARVFGGWVHPGQRADGSYNLSWPIVANDEGQLEIGTSFAGFYGRGYDAPAEFDYFEARFPRRNAAEISAENTSHSGFTFSLSPNPASDYVDLRTQEELNQTVTIEVVNQFGRRVRTERVKFGQEYRVNLNRVKEGLYFIIVTTEEQQQSVRTLIIQR